MSDKRVNWLKRKNAKARKAKRAKASELERKKKRKQETTLAGLRAELIQRTVERDIREERFRSYMGLYEIPRYWINDYSELPYPPFSWWQEQKQEKVDWKKEGF